MKKKKAILFAIYGGYLRIAVENLNEHFQELKEPGPKPRKYTKMNTTLARIIEVDDLQARRISASENIQREDLSAIETVEAILEIVDAELIKDKEYASIGKKPAERVNILLGKLKAMGRGKERGFSFQGGMQMDRYGNVNMIGIGPYDNVKVRGPGSVGTTWEISIEHSYLFFWHHNPRVFVEKVDYISGPGYLQGGESRWKVAKPQAKGPAYVYTPICVMDFEETTRAARLRSTNPGYTKDDVINNTGFHLIVPENVPDTLPPTDEELKLLRTRVDRDAILGKFRLSAG